MSRPMRKDFFFAGKRGSATFLGVDLTGFFICFLETPCTPRPTSKQQDTDSTRGRGGDGVSNRMKN